MNLIGNFLLLLFLIPLLIFLILFISFNSLKAKVKTCDQCGTISLGMNNICINCGANFDNMSKKNFEKFNNPSEKIIEVKAEEIK